MVKTKFKHKAASGHYLGLRMVVTRLTRSWSVVVWTSSDGGSGSPCEPHSLFFSPFFLFLSFPFFSSCYRKIKAGEMREFCRQSNEPSEILKYDKFTVFFSNRYESMTIFHMKS